MVPAFDAPTGPARTYPLVRCTRCGLVFQASPRSVDELDHAQTNAYGARQRRFNPVVEAGVRTFRMSRIRLATQLATPGDRVLDVGCGRAVFLSMLRDRGYDVVGTELSAETAANADPTIDVRPGELTEGMFESDSFDLVSIWHVLEHMRRPDEALSLVQSILRPGGALMIAVPNFGSAQSRMAGEHWFHLDLPRHIFHFTPETLRRVIEQSGLRVDRMTTGQWEMDPFGWVQSVMNRAGLRHNAMYDALRNNPAVQRDLSLSKRAALVALFPISMAAAVPLSAARRLRRDAGTIIVVARKP